MTMNLSLREARARAVSLPKSARMMYARDSRRNFTREIYDIIVMIIIVITVVTGVRVIRLTITPHAHKSELFRPYYTTRKITDTIPS